MLNKRSFYGIMALLLGVAYTMLGFSSINQDRIYFQASDNYQLQTNLETSLTALHLNSTSNPFGICDVVEENETNESESEPNKSKSPQLVNPRNSNASFFEFIKEFLSPRNHKFQDNQASQAFANKIIKSYLLYGHLQLDFYSEIV